MDHEIQQRVWAAGAYAGLTAPKLAKALGVGVDTLKRTVRGERGLRVFESEENFLARVAKETGVPIAFFTADFDRLYEIAEPAEMVYTQRTGGAHTTVSGPQTPAEHMQRLAEAIAYFRLLFEAETSGHPAGSVPDPDEILEEMRARGPRRAEIEAWRAERVSAEADAESAVDDASDVPDSAQLGQDHQRDAQDEDEPETGTED